MQVEFTSGGVTLRGHLAYPHPSAVSTSKCGLVLCHGFPAEPPGQRNALQSYPELADRLSTEAGWVVLSFDFPGAGESEGDFSMPGWLGAIESAVAYLRNTANVEGVWLAGFGTGGALALCAAGEDEAIKGVATFAAPADFESWTVDPRRFLDHARHVGVIKTKDFPVDFDAWTRELRETRPLNLIGKIPPRPVLIAHGGEDGNVPLFDARALADAADNEVELRVLSGAGHRLRHDPRAIAVLLGWLDRQHV